MRIPAIMRALQQTSLNGPQDLRLITDAPVPVPGHRRQAGPAAVTRPDTMGGIPASPAPEIPGSGAIRADREAPAAATFTAAGARVLLWWGRVCRSGP
jgi:hypothetical protein